MSTADNCFDGLGSTAHVAAYANGDWVRAAVDAPYRIGDGFWASLGSRVASGSMQDYGHCDAHGRQRPLYSWAPRGCSLRPFEADGACELLRDRQIVVVGDSTVLQTFLSLVLLLCALSAHTAALPRHRSATHRTRCESRQHSPLTPLHLTRPGTASSGAT